MATERIIEADALASAEAVVNRHMPGKRYLLVCDDATYMAAGERLFMGLPHEISPHSIGRNKKAQLELTNPVIAAAKLCDGLIAVGSGTVNDITKYAAHALNLPYVSVATAASMNGYTSASASLEHEGYKQSFAATPPLAVIADLDVITKAPKRLMRAGIGDTLCRSSVEADCYLSHRLLGTKYDESAFKKLRAHEATLMNDSMTVIDNNPVYIRCLVEALMDAGDAMAKAGDSTTASQGEHMIAHTLELMYESDTRYIHHGEMVAVASVTMTQLQHKMLLGLPKVKPLPREATQFQRLFSKKIGNMLAPVYARKVLSADQADSINRIIETQWPDIRAHLEAIMIKPSVLERVMLMANMATTNKKIGISDDCYNSAVTYAHMTRDRFTFLDLAAMTGKRVA